MKNFRLIPNLFLKTGLGPHLKMLAACVLITCAALIPCKGQDFIEDEIYLKIEDTSSFEIVFPPSGNIAGSQHQIYSIFTAYGVTSAYKPFSMPSPKLERIYRVAFTQTSSIEQFIAELTNLDIVEYAEKIPIHKACDIPNDPLIAYQLALIKAYEAFDVHKGGSLIAIIDNAFLTAHEDLAPNIVSTRDVADGDNNVNPPESDNFRWTHGTRMAGVAGARTNNDLGIASAGWNNSLMLVKCVKNDAENPHGFTHAVEAIDWAVTNGAKIINLSYASFNPSQTEYTSIQVGRQNGVVFVAAAGNANATIAFPAGYGEGISNTQWEPKTIDSRFVLAVGSVNQNNSRSYWGVNSGTIDASNYGLWVDIASYGSNIYSTSLNPEEINNISVYDHSNGTSVASPLIASAIAFLHSYKPNIPLDDVVDCLLSTTDRDIYASSVNPPNLTGTLGTGRLNLLKALQCLSTDCSVPPIAAINSSSKDNSVCPNQSVTLSANIGTTYLWSNGASTKVTSVGQAGTYTVTVTFSGGCSSTASIEILPAMTEPVMYVSEYSGHTPNDGILCSGDPVNVTAWYGKKYQWMGSTELTQTLNAIRQNLTQAESLQFTVTITDVGGCPGVVKTISTVVTWNPKPVASVQVEEISKTPNDRTICNGHSAVLRAFGGVSYAWSTGNNLPPFANGNPISVTPTQTTAYYVTVTDVNGCTDVKVITIVVINCTPPPCPCSGTNTIAIDVSEEGAPYSVLESIYNYDKNDDGILDISDHGGCISINGRLIIDGNLFINDCQDIRMQPCSEIIVRGGISLPQSGSLAMRNNIIHGCGSMWRGITVQPHASLSFRFNTISDAQFANNIMPAFTWGFTPLPTRVDIQINKYLRNHVGVNIPGNNAQFFGGVVWQTSFVGNTFECAGTNNNLGPLLPPCEADLPNYEQGNGYAGVVVRGANFRVGRTVEASNSFTNLRNGIIAENVELTADYNIFNNMIGFMGTDVPTFTNSRGIGISTTNCWNRVKLSRFDGAGHAMYFSRGLANAVQYSTTTRVRNSLNAYRPWAMTIEDYNQFGFLDNGIVAEDLQDGGVASSFKIVNNTLNTEDTKTNGDGFSAIRLSNGNPYNLPEGRGTIAGNTLNINDIISEGIFVKNQNLWVVNNNTVELTPRQDLAPIITQTYRFENSSSNFFYGNHSNDLTNGNGGIGNSNGFVINGTDNTFCCNSTSGNSIGAQFLSGCDGTHYRTFDHQDHTLSLWIWGGTIIGDQPDQSNGPATNSNIFNCNSGMAANDNVIPFLIQQSEFYVTESTCPEHPPVAQPAMGWFYNLVTEINDVICASDPACTPPPPPAPPGYGRGRITDSDLNTAADEEYSSPRYMALQWERARDLYARLKKYPQMHGINSSIDAFYATAEQGSALKTFYDAEQAIAAARALPSGWALAIKNAIDSVGAIEASAEQALGALANAQNRADSLETYWSAERIRSGKIPHIAFLLQKQHEADSIQRVDANALLPTINALPSGNVLQSNRKTALKIAAELMAGTAPRLNAAQLAEITPVAYQCLLEGGSAVSLARALYQLNQAAHFDDFILCGESLERSKKKTASSTNDFRLYPNPSKDVLYIEMPPLENAGLVVVEFVDLTGRSMLRQQFDRTVDKGVIDLSRFSNGIYHCRIYSNGCVVSVSKLAVVR